MNQESYFSGTWIVGMHGSGKTTLLLTMIAAKLKQNCSIVVMDSKGQLTDAVRRLDLGDRLIVVDPDIPMAINPFDVKGSQHVISQLGYMLGGLLETNITPKQRTFFETLVAALLHFPNPSLPLLWDIVSKGPRAYVSQIQHMPGEIQSFFGPEWDTYSDTSKEMQWRLRGILSKPLIKQMFNAPKTRFHIDKAIDSGQVVVIDNSQVKCTPEGCGFIGRLFVAQIWSAGTARQLLPDHQKKPTYVFIDEAHLVIKKDQKIAAIIDELRSQKIALVLAHQRVGHIEDPNVRGALENCAIKMANVDAEAEYFSKLLHIPLERMNQLPRGHFAMHERHERGGTSSIVEVTPMPFHCRQMSEQEQLAHRERMIRLYGVQPAGMLHDGKQQAQKPPEGGPRTAATVAPRPNVVREHRESAPSEAPQRGLDIRVSPGTESGAPTISESAHPEQRNKRDPGEPSDTW